MSQSYLIRHGKGAVTRRPRLTNALWWAEAAVVRLIWGTTGRLPVDRASQMGAALMRRAGPRVAKHRHLLANLALAFPDETPRAREALARDIWAQIGRVVAEYPHLETICGTEAGERLVLEDRYGLDRVRHGKAPALFVSAHTANWEMAAGSARVIPLPLSVVYSPQTNPFVHAALQRRREALRCGFIDRRHGARGIIRTIQAKHSIGILLDQRYDEGEDVSFFGHPTPAGTGPAALALKLGVDYVPMRVERLHDARFRATFYEPLRPLDPKAPPAEQALDLTQRVHGLFEDWIRERPEQWLCLKRRWPRAVMRAAGVAA